MAGSTSREARKPPKQFAFQVSSNFSGEVSRMPPIAYGPAL
jgi:hypothetical protein